METAPAKAQENFVTSEELLSQLKARNFDFFSGVPDSVFKRLIPLFIEDNSITYIPSVREDFAIATAAGARMGGRKSAVFMENSGLGNSCDALTSLTSVYEIPVLLLIAWAGYEGKDVPHHNVMGLAMCSMLESMGIPALTLEGPEDVAAILDGCEEHLNVGKTVALLIRPEGLK